MAKQAANRTKASTPRKRRTDVMAPAAQPMLAEAPMSVPLIH